ncbi:MAG: hypothetical protein HC930_12910 [Hydrococcus sp. SU_1_0]|nr:hypothetical protein [Hydrococcus sp. SU_1_0]
MKSWWRWIAVILLTMTLVLGLRTNLSAQGSPSWLVQQAQQQYQLGKSVQALELLAQAGKIYQSQQQLLPQAEVWALTSLVQQQQGYWKLARTNLQRSLAVIDTVPSSPDKIQ